MSLSQVLHAIAILLYIKLPIFYGIGKPLCAWCLCDPTPHSWTRRTQSIQHTGHGPAWHQPQPGPLVTTLSLSPPAAKVTTQQHNISWREKHREHVNTTLTPAERRDSQ